MKTEAGVYVRVNNWYDANCGPKCPAFKFGSCKAQHGEIIECILSHEGLTSEERDSEKARLLTAYRSGRYYYAKRGVSAGFDIHYSNPELAHVYDIQQRMWR